MRQGWFTGTLIVFLLYSVLPARMFLFAGAVAIGALAGAWVFAKTHR